MKSQRIYPPTTRLIGTVLLNKYIITRIRSQSRLATTYEATNTKLTNTVAVHILTSSVAPAVQKQFYQEAKVASRINHPGVMSMYDFGVTRDHLPFIVTEVITGTTLREYLNSNTLSHHQAIAIATQILAALHQAHQCGVLHCHLSPRNILVTRLKNGRFHIKLSHLGLAGSNQTKSLQWIIDSAHTMAPEQIRGDATSPATDVYAVGSILFRLIAGVTTFRGTTNKQILQQQLYAQPQNLTKIVPTCPPLLSAVVDKALCKSPTDRYPTAEAMQEALLTAIATESSPLRCPQCRIPMHLDQTFCASCGYQPDSAVLPIDSQLAYGDDSLFPETHTEPGEQTLDSGSRLRINEDRCRAPFVGREYELSALTSFCHRQTTSQTTSQTIALLAPSGMGKSRLVQELKDSCKNAAVHILAPDPTCLARPWQVIREFLYHQWDVPQTVTSSQMEAILPTTSIPIRDYPAVLEIITEKTTRDLEPEVLYREVFSAMKSAVLATCVRGTTTVFVLDDFEQFDEPSRRLLTELTALTELGGTPSSPLRWILCTTSQQILPPGIQQVALPALSAFDCATIAFATSEVDVSSDALQQRSGGNPLRVQLLAGWVELGHPPSSAPASLGDLVTATVEHLPVAIRRILQAASIHGCKVSVQTTEYTLGAKITQDMFHKLPLGLVSLSFLSQQKLGSRLSSTSATKPKEQIFTFASPTVALLIASTIPSQVRRDMHKRCWEELPKTAHPAIAGYHAENTKSSNKEALAYLQTAGQLAIQQFDDKAAENLLARGLRVARRLHTQDPSATSDSYMQVATQLVELLIARGKYRLTQGILDEAKSLALVPQHQSTVAWLQSKLHLATAQVALAVQEANAAIHKALSVGNQTALCQAYLQKVLCLQRDGQPYAATLELLEAIDVITAGHGLDSPPTPSLLLWEIAILAAHSLWEQNKHKQALSFGHGALGVAIRLHSPKAKGRTSRLLSNFYAELGQHSRATQYRQRALRELNFLGDRQSTSEILLSTVPASAGPTDQNRNLHLALTLAQEIGWSEGVRRAQAQLSQHQ